MSEVLFIFHSVHNTLQAEEILKNYGLDFLLVPVPPWINEGCGLGIQLKAEKQLEACHQIEKAGIQLLNIVEKTK